MQRYWDGAQWTEHRAPAQAKPERDNGGVIIAAYAAALLIPIVGFILSIVLMAKNEVGHGFAALLLSFVMTGVYVSAF